MKEIKFSQSMPKVEQHICISKISDRWFQLHLDTRDVYTGSR